MSPEWWAVGLLVANAVIQIGRLSIDWKRYRDSRSYDANKLWRRWSL